jgi:nicotinamide riboside kinase
VPEVARAYLESKPTPGYGPTDVEAIAVQQLQAEQNALAGGAPVIVADTDQRILQLWWAEKYPGLTSGFENCVDKQDPQRHYLLCYPDLAWEPDPLRENPQDRQRLFRLQLQALEHDNANFRVVWGRGAIRERRAWHYVKHELLKV